MQTFASGSLLQAAVQVIQVAGQHPDRLRQHPDTGKNRRQSHGPLAADLLSGNRGKISEEDTTETPMYVNRGGRLTILQEDQGQLLTLAGEPDGKLRAAGR